MRRAAAATGPLRLAQFEPSIRSARLRQRLPSHRAHAPMSSQSAPPPSKAYDVVIVGGGVIGCSAAYHLAVALGTFQTLAEKTHISTDILPPPHSDLPPISSPSRLSCAPAQVRGVVFASRWWSGTAATSTRPRPSPPRAFDSSSPSTKTSRSQLFVTI